MRTLWFFCTVLAVREKRPGCHLPTQRKVLVLENKVQPPGFTQESVRLSNWGLFVSVAVNLQGRLRFKEVSRRMKIGEQQKRQTNLAILVCLANIDERPAPALMLFATHDGMHSADRAVERNRGGGLALCGFGLRGQR